MNLTKVITIKYKMKFSGIGHDIIDISRIDESISKFGDRFLLKLFSEKEIAYCNSKATPAIHFAGRFAAKEAISKALGTGFGEYLKWQDIEILNDDLGKPVVTLSEELKEQYPNHHISVSISHTKEIASAVAILHIL